MIGDWLTTVLATFAGLLPIANPFSTVVVFLALTARPRPIPPRHRLHPTGRADVEWTRFDRRDDRHGSECWIQKAARIAFAALGAATILEMWGIAVAPIIAGLGLFGVAVALGAQDLFKNLIAGLFVIGERRFHPGDWICVDGLVEGTVEEIGFRTTTVRRWLPSSSPMPGSRTAL